ncbi:MAG: RNA polymerase sigma factor [Bacteroidales bacterium]|nr:RNA polymerase sigma factor [Bacteroidales bacterium]
MQEDNAIIALIRAGDKEAYRQLVERYQQKVFQTCMGFVHNEADAADLSQDIFIRAYEKLSSFKGEAQFSTWLYRMSSNMAINFIRKRKLRSWFQRLDEGHNNIDLSSGEYADTHMLRSEQKKLLKQALGKLNSAQQKAFVLSHYQDLSNQELADVMGLSLKATESLLFRARARMQANLKQIIKTENHGM